MKTLFTFCGEEITAQTLKERPWLSFLYATDRSRYSIERVASVSEVHPDEVLRYVERSLMCIREDLKKLTESERLLVETTLKWSEVAKCGSDKKREIWKKKGYDLAVHNEGSASIFLKECREIEDAELRESAAILIRTHGLLGQYLRGEVLLAESREILEMPVVTSGAISVKRLEKLLYVLNKGIMQAVSEGLWNRLEGTIRETIHNLCCGKIVEFTTEQRLGCMLPAAFAADRPLTEKEFKLYRPILENCDLWYPQAALNTFSREELEILFGQVALQLHKGIRHISFYELSTTLYYDYEGKKKENVYKRRIIESFLKSAAQPEKRSGVRHAFLKCIQMGDTLCVDIGFTPVCEKLIDFCVEAERSGIVDYQKNITAIFDIFGFRRDIFDRLNNEDHYLATMNDAQASRKTEILDMITGEILVDVGSGGGVLLDAIERRFPDKTIIGTDISANVIEALNQKIRKEGHGYQVLKHNFVDGPLPFQADTIIFSSILHEIYSYSVYRGERFRIESVLNALKNAAASLKPGGRLLIRDGIYTDAVRMVSIRMKTQEGLNFLLNYRKDFEGLPVLERAGLKTMKIDRENRTVTADINYLREFLYTYTWGEDSYSCEVNEQFGYLTLTRYKEVLEELGLTILHAEEYCEAGYEEHLSPLVELMDFSWKDIPSNCILAAEMK